MADFLSSDARLSRCPASEPTSALSANVPRSLLMEALDRCNELRDIARAYVALENFVAPEFDRSNADVQISRDQLRALLALLNGEAARRIDTAIEAVEAVREGGEA
jgi:hypothetical protein